jgi:hypothetical protein
VQATSIHLQWLEPGLDRRFRTGVSLHSHTLHSLESLDFIYQAARYSSILRWALRKGEARYLKLNGEALDLRRGWWTPPLGAREAHEVESSQITSFGFAPIISLTDHDDIEAPMSLQAMDASLNVPVSVEWTVPYRATFFHVGVHNLAPRGARGMMRRFRNFTARPEEWDLAAILDELHADAGTLIVLNHPFWDEQGVGAPVHNAALLDFLTAHRQWIHAIEINGLRPWEENRESLRLAKDWSKPAVAGGDRHALEPNAVLNLTSAAGMQEFVAEVRAGLSRVLITPRYREPYRVRILHNILDVFRTYADHGRGWTEWSDRVFYTLPGGAVESLTQIWGPRPPTAVNIFAGIMRFAGQPPVRQALRAALPQREEVAP